MDNIDYILMDHIPISVISTDHLPISKYLWISIGIIIDYVRNGYGMCDYVSHCLIIF